MSETKSDVIEIREERFDLFDPPEVSADVIKTEYVVYSPDAGGEDLTAIASTGYRVQTKDLDSFLNPSKGYLECLVAGTLSLGAAAKVAGVASADETAGVKYLPVVAAADYASIQAANTALEIRGRFNGDYNNAVGIGRGGFSLFSNMKYTQNSVVIEDVPDPAEVAAMRFLTSSSKNNARAMEYAHMYTPDRLTAHNVRANNLGSTIVCLPLSAIFGSLNQGTKWTRGISHVFNMTAENTMTKILQSFATDGAIVNITACSLYVKRMRLYIPIIFPSNDAIYRYEKLLLSKNSSL